MSRLAWQAPELMPSECRGNRGSPPNVDTRGSLVRFVFLARVWGNTLCFSIPCACSIATICGAGRRWESAAFLSLRQSSVFSVFIAAVSARPSGRQRLC